VLENKRFRLEIDPQTGCVASLRDKQAGIEVFSGLAARPVVLADLSDTWGHDTFRWEDVIGAFEVETVKLVEHGPVKSVIRVINTYGTSHLTQDFMMYPDREQIDVRVVVDWREQLKMLKLRFPVNVKFMKVTRESAYGHIEFFANGDEYPVQSWVDVSGTAREREIPYGLSVLNDGKYSLDVNVRDIGLTLLRSPAYAHHIPAELKPAEQYAYIDQGVQQCNYTLLPHSGSWETAGTARRAIELNQRMVPLFVTSHPDGKLPQSDAFISVEPENIMVTVLKQAEDDDALIVRAVETSKFAVRGEINLPHWERTIAANFGPCEIKTFRVPRDPDQPVSEVNLLEWPA
jgi:alpha-mannosidase